MNNRTGITREGNEAVNIPRLIIITVVMALGGVAGSIYAAGVLDADYFNLSNMYGSELFKCLDILNLAPVFAVFLSSYFGYGAVIVVASAFCRGFTFAVPLTDKVQDYGLSGYYSGFSLCGILSVAAVIIMSMQAIGMSAVRRGGIYHRKSADEYAKNTFLLMVCCATAVVFGAALDAFLLK
ncbi:MAG: hypothetical protein J6V15_01115 [Clostridia bacterium]|nr:hypothetical protein [Clostridia bacterium]